MKDTKANMKRLPNRSRVSIGNRRQVRPGYTALSANMNRILDYLADHHGQGMEVVPVHWLLIDLYGVSGHKKTCSGSHSIYEQNPAAKASLFRSLRRLVGRRLIVCRYGVTDQTEWPNRLSPDGYFKSTAWGYALASEPVSDYMVRHMAISERRHAEWDAAKKDT